MSFGLGTFAAGGDAFPGLVVEERVLDLRPALGTAVTTGELLADWHTSLERLHAIAGGPLDGAVALADVRPLAPVQPPGQLFLGGANYHKHLRQIAFTMARNAPGETRSDEELQAEAEAVVRRQAASGLPFVFSVQPSALSGARDEVVLWGPGVEHDWELELAVVIGRPARDIGVEAALDHVAGYTIANDVSTRDVMNRPNFPMTDFLMTKGRPTFKPVGPYIVPREFVPDYRALRITLSVNGEVMQDEGVDDIIFGVEQLVSYASSVTDLRPGDLLLTGSPAGNAGHHGNRWLRPGDVMEGSITGLGVQRTPCVADPRGQRASSAA
jgi:2-keto-4-pentenoate hydratase/2-oxohepta-3-ene-1,7-dioic acid hydratase in catechol pathway